MEYKIVALKEIPEATVNFDENANLLELSELFLHMQKLCEASNGIGLHAVQAGIPYNIFVAKLDGLQFENFISCRYEGMQEKIDSIEGCLSITDDNGFSILYKLKRYPKILLKGYKLVNNQLVEVNDIIEGFSAIIAQHECDHGENILISTIGEPYVKL